MISVVSAGAAARIAARTSLRVERAGSGTAARYSSTVLGTLLRFAAELRCAGFGFFMVKPQLTVLMRGSHNSRMGVLGFGSAKAEGLQVLTGEAASGTMSCPLCRHS